MIDELIQRPFWMWLILACVFLAIEVVVVPLGGFFLCIGSAAAIVSVVAFFVPDISWQWAVALFSVLMVIAIALWWKFIQKRRAAGKNSTEETLNSREKLMIGYQAVLTEAILHGRGKMKVQDSPWPVEAEEDYPAGTRVEVVEVNGITLKIRAITT